MAADRGDRHRECPRADADDAVSSPQSSSCLVGETAAGRQPGGDPGEPAAGRRGPGEVPAHAGDSWGPGGGQGRGSPRQHGRVSRLRKGKPTATSGRSLYTADDEEREWLQGEARRAGHVRRRADVLDPTAGGGSIPFEAARLGLAHDRQRPQPGRLADPQGDRRVPRASTDKPLLEAVSATRVPSFVAGATNASRPSIPPEPLPDCVADDYLWARTITCPYCGGLVPLSPNWRLDSKGTGVRLVPHTDDPEHRHCTFEIVDEGQGPQPRHGEAGGRPLPLSRLRPSDRRRRGQDAGPGRPDGPATLRRRLQADGQDGHHQGRQGQAQVRPRLPCPSTRGRRLRPGRGRPRGQAAEWEARNIYPDEDSSSTGYRRTMRDCIDRYGFNHWTDFFSPRQLLGHCTSVEVFHELVDEIREQQRRERPGTRQGGLVVSRDRPRQDAQLQLAYRVVLDADARSRGEHFRSA